MVTGHGQVVGLSCRSGVALPMAGFTKVAIVGALGRLNDHLLGFAVLPIAGSHLKPADSLPRHLDHSR